MPFIGLDWRSPGESWIKTPVGSWERQKILESYASNRDDLSILSPSQRANLSSSPSPPSSLPNDSFMASCRHRSASSSSESERSEKENSPCLTTVDPETKPAENVYQPFCQIVNKPTRERRDHVSLSEAFWKLDFPGAVRDPRRFNYVCKVLDVLISEKLTTLGGQAQKLLFSTLDHVFGQVLSTQQNMDIIRLLMQDLNAALEKSNMMWGKHMGSSVIWDQHRQRLQQWNNVMQDLQIHKREEDGKIQLTDLPEECVRLILLCLSSHHDLLHAEEAFKKSQSVSVKFGRVFNEQRLWKDLCTFHFKPEQLKEVTTKMPTNTKEDWEKIYYRMKRHYGLRECYADSLHFCPHCRTVFWQAFGHPCPVNGVDENGVQRTLAVKPAIPICPRSFLDFFCL